jgi:predicted ATPase
MDKLFAALTGDEEIVAHRQLQVWGRDLDIPLSTSKAAKFSFPDLCVKSLSAADYLEITKNFETVFITDVPQLSLDTKDQARRFILFIDAAYEVCCFVVLASCRLFISLIPDTMNDRRRRNYSFYPILPFTPYFRSKRVLPLVKSQIISEVLWMI